MTDETTKTKLCFLQIIIVQEQLMNPDNKEFRKQDKQLKHLKKGVLVIRTTRYFVIIFFVVSVSFS